MPGRFGWSVPVALHAVSLTAWLVVAPPMESPGAVGHYEYARHVANAGRPLKPGTPGYDDRESFHPPLYYLAVGAAVRPLAPIPAPALRVDPSSRFLGKGGTGARVFLEGSQRVMPYALAMRIASALMSFATVVAVWAAVSGFAQSTTIATRASSMLVLVPQFGYLSAAISNDVLVTALCAVTFVGILRITGRGGVWAAAIAGALAGLAVVAKTSAVALVPVGVLAVLLARPPRRRVLPLLAFLSAWTLAGGWWVVQHALAGQLVLREPADAMQAGMDEGLAAGPFHWLVRVPAVVFCTFWGWFGWMTVRLPAFVYAVYAALSAALGAGVVMYARRMRHAWPHAQLRQSFVALAALVPGFAALLEPGGSDTAFHARLMYPVLVPMVVLGVAGASEVAARVPPLMRSRLWAATLTIAIAAWVTGLARAATAFESDPAPREAITVARPMGSWQGRGNQMIGVMGETGRFHVRWEVRTEHPRGTGTFRLSLSSGVSGRVIQVIADHRGEGRGDVVLEDDPRMYNFVVESANVEWSFQVDELYRLPSSIPSPTSVR